MRLTKSWAFWLVEINYDTGEHLPQTDNPTYGKQHNTQRRKRTSWCGSGAALQSFLCLWLKRGGEEGNRLKGVHRHRVEKKNYTQLKWGKRGREGRTHLTEIVIMTICLKRALQSLTFTPSTINNTSWCSKLKSQAPDLIDCVKI